jgi:hypothetical protein
MRGIIIFLLAFTVPIILVAQCPNSPLGGLVSGEKTICVGSSTGNLTATGQSGSYSWEVSTNGGNNWTSLGNTNNSTYSNTLYSPGTYLYRVAVVCPEGGDYTFSNSEPIVVKYAEAGTLTGGGNFCLGAAPSALTFSGGFGDINWEYKYNGGQYTPYIHCTGSSCNPILLSLAGIYTFRVRTSCFGSASDKYSNEVNVVINNPTEAAICNDPNELRKSIAMVNISGIPYAFSGFLINNMNNDGRLLFLTTSHPFTRYNPNASALASATFTWNHDLNACNSAASATSTSTGCTIVSTDGFFTLLELKTAPNLPLLWYLGWDISATGNFSSIFQSANGVKKGRVSTTGGFNTVSATISNSTDALTETSGNNVLKFASWTAGNTEKRGRGAPLLSDKKARGVYIGGPEVNCGNGPSFFADLAKASNILSVLRAGNTTATNSATVKMNYCIPFEELSGPFNQTKTYQVSKYIKSSQSISNNYSVKYQAGTYIELQPGFVSGTDFVAEMNPCVSVVNIIAAKTDETEYFSVDEKANDNLRAINWLKVYPTILPSGNALTLESSKSIEGLEIQLYNIDGRHVRSYRLNGFGETTKTTLETADLPAGFYVLHAQDGSNLFTQKIVLQ